MPGGVPLSRPDGPYALPCTAQLWHGCAGLGLLEHGQDLAVGES